MSLFDSSYGGEEIKTTLSFKSLCVQFSHMSLQISFLNLLNQNNTDAVCQETFSEQFSLYCQLRTVYICSFAH